MFQRLIEKMELHNELNPKLWDGNKLRSEVEDKIEDIIDQFIIELQENEIPIKILDVRLVGSNASFNYTENSDLDIHIIANFEDTSCDVPVLNLLYNFFKKNFNDKYTISIHGVPIELYVEDVNSSAVSNGVYSIFGRKWIKFPEPIEVPDIDITDVFAPYEERYNEIMEHKDVEAASSLIDDLYLLRKDSISTDGEYGEGNLIFKEFRNKGYLDNLKQLLVDETSKELSLESLNEDIVHVDSDGNELSSEQLSFFKDSKIQKGGKLIPCYHNATSEFNIFKHTAEPWDLDFGLGFYFGMGKNEKEFQHKNNSLKCYLNIKNPLVVNVVGDDKLNEIVGQEELLYAEGMQQDKIMQEIHRLYGVDGLVIPEENWAVAFFPNQIKLTSNKAPTLSPAIDESMGSTYEKLTESRNHMDFEEMVEQAAVRHPKPEDIFEKPWDKLVDPKTFFDKLTSNASKEYKANTRKRIVKTDSTQSFYKTILGYLDSLSINKEYPKLEPASYQIKMGEFVPVDGRHRAQLCLMLGMPLPVKEVKPNKLEESKHGSFNALAYHGSDTKFDKFDISKAGAHDAGQWGKGIYLTNKKEIASNFGGKYIYTCRINLKNPYYVETENDIADYIALAEDNDQVTEILKEQGYDGVISKNETWYNPQDIMSPLIADQYVVFDPKDIEILEVKEILDESLKDNKKLDDIISKLLIENPNNYKLGKATDLEPNAPYFILPNGKILYGMYNHLEVEQDLHLLNLSNYQNTEYDDLDYNDSTLFDLGCIRGRYSSDIFNDMGYVLLTKDYPTLSQFDSLGEIIAKAKSERIDDIEFMNYNESKYHDYELREYEPEDIIKKLKRFYASGKFYEGLDEDWVKNFIPVDNYYNSQKLNEAEDSGDWGYHYGDLGNKSDRRGNFGGRNSGGFGTGTYFVGTPISQRKDGEFYKNRPEHKIDFSKYHLFKPSTNEAAYNLHDALLAFNNMEPDFKEAPPTWDEVLTEFEKMSNEYWAPLDNLGDESPSTPVKLNTKPLLQYIRKYINYYPYKITKDDNLMDIAQDIEKELIKEASSFEKSLHNLSSALHYYDEDKLRKIVVTALKDKSDKAPSTLIMQALGYDGIDVRHLNHDAQGLAGLDNFGFGSVIYNLKEGIEETGKSSIKAIIFTTDEKPRKNILPFKDFTIDGIYSLGENTYIAFEKRWEYDPRGISFIHADVADDYILPYFPNFTENMQTQDAYIEMDNFQFPNIFTNIDEIKNGIHSKYYSLILQEMNKWFR